MTNDNVLQQLDDADLEIASLKMQLAAERKLKERAIVSWATRNLQLREQLAAERRKVKLLEDELNEAVKLLKLEDIDGAISKLSK